MDCQRVTSLIVEYLSWALDAQATSAWDHHIRSCRDCSAYLNTYLKTIEAIQSLPSRRISPEARERIQRSVQYRITHSSPLR